MPKITLFVLSVLLLGAGCSYKYESDWDNQDRAGQQTPDRPACNLEGEEMYPELPCCADLVPTPVDHAKTVCAKPGTPAYKPRVCAAPGEVVTVDTPNCCAGLDVVEKDNKFVCEPMK